MNALGYVWDPPLGKDGVEPQQRIGLLYGIQQQEPRLNIKTVLSTYGDFHVKDKTAVRTSYL